MKLPKQFISENLKKGTIGAMLAIRNPSEELRRELVKYFTFPNPQYAAACRFSPWGPPKGIPENISLYWYSDEEKTEIMIPRGIVPEILSTKACAEFNRIQWRDRTTNCPVEFPELRLTLSSEQQTLLTSYHRSIAKRQAPFRAFLFIAPTSTGKTLAQAAVAAATGQRTLVLCLTDQIKRAWYVDLEKGYGLSNKDVGLIQQSKWKIGEHFTLASVQTLARRKERWNELCESIGTVIVDEADTISAPSIYDFLLSFPARNIIGATATHMTAHGRNNYLDCIFGNPIKRIASSQKDTHSSISLKDVDLIFTPFVYKYQQGALDFHDMCEKMMENEDRNKLIVAHIAKDVREGHTVLAVTRRVPHVHLLSDMLQEVGVEHALLTGETNGSKEYTDKLVADTLSGKNHCIVATSAAIKRGANLNTLDVLHLLMPQNNTDLEQLIGRIRRRAEGKNTCILRYYLDSQTAYLNNAFKRNVTVFRKLKVPRYKNVFIA